MSDLFKKIVKTEFTYQVTRPLFFVFTIIFFLLAFNDITITGSSASGLIRIGDIQHNSSLVISRLLAILGILSIIVAPFIIAQALQKDFDTNTHSIFYSYPVTDTEYIWGRFLGAFLSYMIIPISVLTGAGVGHLTLSDDFLGAFNLGAYLLPFVFIVIPGLLFTSLVIYLVTIKTRKSSTTYLSAIVLFLLIFFIQAFIDDQLRYASDQSMSNLQWLTLLDPSGISAINYFSEGMTIFEKNEFNLLSNAFLLFHRVCWMLICVGLFGVIHKSFKRTYSHEKKSRKINTETGVNLRSVIKLIQIPRVKTNHAFHEKVKSLARFSWSDFKFAVINFGFVLVTLLSLFSLHSNFNKNVDSAGIYPTTQYFINNGMANVDMPILLLILFFTGVIFWKEKDFNFETILYSYPLSNSFIYVQKLVSISLIMILYFAIIFGYGVFTQIVLYGYSDISFQGYTHYIIGYSIFRYLVIVTAFLFLHAISPNKFIGYGLSLLGILFVLLGPSLGVETHLMLPGTLPEVAYSHLNSLNPVNTINFWYRIYWCLFIGLTCSIGILIWNRGNRLNFVKLLWEDDKKMIAISSVMALAFVSVGGFIAVKSGSFQAGNSKLQTYLMYEKEYKQFEHIAQPVISAVSLNVDLFPSIKSGLIKGNYELINYSEEPINAIHMSLIGSDATELKHLEFDSEGMFQIKDERVGYYIYALNTPLQPEDSISFNYELTFIENKYKEQDFNLELVQNGMIISSFVGQVSYFPQVGYKRELEVQDEDIRAEFGLNPQAFTLTALSDSTQPTRMSRDIIHYQADISTEANQTAISSGQLVEAWQEDNRNYFKYRSHRPINGEFGIVSGRYKKYSETADGLTVNIFYDESHDYNLQSMTEGIIDSYKFNEAHFESYGHPSINIVEVPGYGVISGTAISKPTLILWNENGGFTTDIARTYIDRVYSTAAHEMAHQWWGHRLRPASFTEGQQLMYETIAQYIRLVSLEEKFGETAAQRFLEEEKYYYLTGVAQSTENEPPLFLANESHIIYNKGTIVMDSLKTLLGEAKLNMILADFYSKYAMKNYPPVSKDFVDVFEKEAPDSVRTSVINLLTKTGLKH